MLQRIQKILAHAGIASRRKSEEIIVQGRVNVNGKKATLGQSADPDKDAITVDGVRLRQERKVYIALNKPKGYATAVSDNFERRLVVDLVKVKERIFPVGRLDKDAEGLLFMTNDGEFANRVMHPRYNVDKVYLAKLETPLADGSEVMLRRGIMIDGFLIRPSRLKLLSKDRKLIELAIHEGRHKIVKRLFREAGSFVRDLIRTEIGHVKLGSLKRGMYRHLDKHEIEAFLK